MRTHKTAMLGLVGVMLVSGGCAVNGPWAKESAQFSSRDASPTRSVEFGEHEGMGARASGLTLAPGVAPFLAPSYIALSESEDRTVHIRATQTADSTEGLRQVSFVSLNPDIQAMMFPSCPTAQIRLPSILSASMVTR